jgi:hypothetical protein
MVTLYIIGAGCSKNYNQCTSPIPGLEAPLNGDFFKIAKKVIDHYQLDFMFSPILGCDHLINDITHLFGTAANNGKNTTDVLNDDRLKLESVMNFFSLQNSILERDIPLLQTSYHSRMRSLNDLLAYTITESLAGPVCNKHLLLAKSMKKGDVVLDFNYDLLLDNALDSEKKLSDSGYYFRFDYVMNDEVWDNVSEEKSQIELLKLHGSLNWLRCSSCGRFLLIRSSKKDKSYWEKLRDCRNLGASTIKCPKCASRVSDIYELERIIIPPTLAKSYDMLEIRNVWRHASMLTDIDRIITIGYRFSEQDAAVDMLLRHMLEHGSFKKKISIQVVNTNPEEVNLRLKSIFSASDITNELPAQFFTRIKETSN